MGDGQELEVQNESRGHDHGVVGAIGTLVYTAHGGEAAEKKGCLFLTNKATMLLKTKDRENEQSQTKPNSFPREGFAERRRREAEYGGVKPPLHQIDPLPAPG